MDKLTLTVITATVLLLLSISIPTTGKLEADNVSYIPAEGQEIESDIRSETADRVLAAYKTCSQCKCCPGPGGTNCSMMQCCYSLFCQPSGKCSLQPIACNCDSCS